MVAAQLIPGDLKGRQLDLAYRAVVRNEPLASLWLAPWRAMETPDPWQEDALQQLVTRSDNVLMCCSRGAGKTEVFACASYLEACLGGYTMILSRSDRQAMRVIARTKRYVERLRLIPVTRSTLHEIEFANGGRVVALPCSGDTIVGDHGITILGIDEAAKIKDSFYALVTPMLAVSEEVTGIKPRLALLSTPFGRQGFFHREWHGEGADAWARHRYTWQRCPRIKPSFIEQERARHGDYWVRQEYECEFIADDECYFNMDGMVGAIMDTDDEPTTLVGSGEDF